MGTAEYARSDDDDSQEVELYGPEDGGLYSSNLRDWVPVCAQLRDGSVRLYWTMRALVIEKHGPVRKLTLMELCYLLPAKPVKPGEKVKPSSIARIRSLLDELTSFSLVTTPEGKRLKTSSRVRASGGALRIRINDLPPRGYTGPRNAFAVLDAVRAPALEAARKAEAHRVTLEAARKAEKKAQVTGQIPSPEDDAGQISSPSGQISSPSGQISSPDSAGDLQDRELPFIPSAQSSRSAIPVRPSVSVGDDVRETTDGRTDGSGVVVEDQGQADAREAAAADAAPLNGNSAATAQPGPGSSTGCAPVVESPGVLLLVEIGAWHPEYLLTGQTLADQGLVVTGMLAAGWKPTSIRQVVTGRPLPVPLTRTVGAIVSARLRQAAAGPVPSPTAAWGVPAQGGPADVDTAPADRTVADVVAHRTQYECAECGRPPAGGLDLCGACAGWPVCATKCGRHVEHGGICPACAQAADAAGIAAHAAQDGTCPGHEGPCGRPIQTLGLCGTCRIKAEAARIRAVAEWEAAREAGVAAVQEAEAEDQRVTAPF
ncbi:hypothetical protein [Streptomyces sp. NPDC058621]|uniref:hypothetical protein n=1 Tax=Streptomyces sp. NPDC058621 TaxID=3346561 RepID=UPI0036535080